MEKHTILGIHITDRLKKAETVQHIFSQYGCNIKTRLGLHEVGNVCSPNGIVLLEMVGDDATITEMIGKLGEIEGIEVQKMVFCH